jgi:chemotaxis protein methyltransferase CheR
MADAQNRAEPLSDTDCTAFLQWALPQLSLRWSGFRKVHGQVCKRLKRRMNDLGVADFAAYRTRLEADPAEWRVLDECCHVTISRFFREKRIFEVLRSRVLPHIAARAHREECAARMCSAGCASGEEPYTLKILWDLEVARPYPGGVPLSIIATDADRAMLARADKACFTAGSLRELPTLLLNQAFDRESSLYCLKRQYREGIEFLQQDLRLGAPPGPFDLILCRYIAFTYFATPLQEQVLLLIRERLFPEGYLVIGGDERLPRDSLGLVPLPGAPQIFVRQSHVAA